MALALLSVTWVPSGRVISRRWPVLVAASASSICAGCERAPSQPVRPMAASQDSAFRLPRRETGKPPVDILRERRASAWRLACPSSPWKPPLTFSICRHARSWSGCDWRQSAHAAFSTEVACPLIRVVSHSAACMAMSRSMGWPSAYTMLGAAAGRMCSERGKIGHGKKAQQIGLAQILLDRMGADLQFCGDLGIRHAVEMGHQEGVPGLVRQGVERVVDQLQRFDQDGQGFRRRCKRWRQMHQRVGIGMLEFFAPAVVGNQTLGDGRQEGTRRDDVVAVARDQYLDEGILCQVAGQSCIVQAPLQPAQQPAVVLGVERLEIRRWRMGGKHKANNLNENCSHCIVVMSRRQSASSTRCGNATGGQTPSVRLKFLKCKHPCAKMAAVDVERAERKMMWMVGGALVLLIARFLWMGYFHRVNAMSRQAELMNWVKIGRMSNPNGGQDILLARNERGTWIDWRTGELSLINP